MNEYSTENELEKSFAKLMNPNLLENLVHDIGQSGVVGEPGHVVSTIIVFNSRLCKHPLNLSPEGDSGVGKSFLICRISEVFSSVSQVAGGFSRTSLIHDTTDWAEKIDDMTYLIDLTGKVIVILEADSCREFLDILKPIRSHDKKEVFYKITEGSGGKHNAKKVIMRGWPVFIAISVKPSEKPEDSTRDLSITPPWSEDKGKAVNLYEGSISSSPWKYPSEKETDRVLHNWDFILIKYLKPALVVNIWGKELAKSFDSKNPRSMRDFKKLLSIFDSSALLHQYQRIIIETKDGERYVIGSVDDLRITSKIAKIVIEPTTKGLGSNVLEAYDNFFKIYCPEDDKKTIREILKLWPKVFGRSISRSTLNERFLYPLHDIGRLNRDDSEKAVKWSISSVDVSESVGIDFDRLEKEFDIESGTREEITDLLLSVDGSRILRGNNEISIASMENAIQEVIASIQSRQIRQMFLSKLDDPLSSCLKNEDKITVGTHLTDPDSSDRLSGGIPIERFRIYQKESCSHNPPELSKEYCQKRFKDMPWKEDFDKLVDAGSLEIPVTRNDIFIWIGDKP